MVMVDSEGTFNHERIISIVTTGCYFSFFKTVFQNQSQSSLDQLDLFRRFVPEKGVVVISYEVGVDIAADEFIVPGEVDEEIYVRLQTCNLEKIGLGLRKNNKI